jgi:hypothetical protein
MADPKENLQDKEDLALGQVLVGKTFPKIWCNKTKPKKSYEGPKLRFLHFCW